MECKICHVAFTEKALYRTCEEFYKPEWMCLNCMKRERPDLYQQAVEQWEQEKLTYSDY